MFLRRINLSLKNASAVLLRHGYACAADARLQNVSNWTTSGTSAYLAI
ncbi:MAG: hypothetical protein JWR69_3435 [Pedosphaera sp.]|nr:hypothetical protein [Pedosphaera sp.]